MTTRGAVLLPTPYSLPLRLRRVALGGVEVRVVLLDERHREGDVIAVRLTLVRLPNGEDVLHAAAVAAQLRRRVARQPAHVTQAVRGECQVEPPLVEEQVDAGVGARGNVR